MSEHEGGARRSSRGTLVIAEDRCKGCELCIDACPPRVLVMSSELNEMGYRYPELTPGCTGCTACQMVCPDFVFSVYRLTAATAPGDRRG
ncbi:4Fe-4S dicluster domain-containing protein [Micromonospora sp. DR5-3]|uniref:4Fe-4S dicluster domain-containing protein n=1 Tax=unclassified Micromonospora TaxID=2617518 RepID=UPI0011DA4880|nr:MULTISPECIES: 4Fe-4S dicluster domain-containing protein [unclassified Micromonospora]MCW3820312.1 4Fe-4S dicluster domain-containing protein [Micromonospora sp. DR5-3]TYC20122.1 4Fe-4S dicluster domain-containing protein [Micromonospora sp. MP36]